MKFKIRPFQGATCAEGSRTTAPSRFESPVQRGCRVTLCPDLEGFDDELYAEVVDANDQELRVRALHDLYVFATNRIVKHGDEFSVTRDHLFEVRAVGA
jgi:hypothetical protein